MGITALPAKSRPRPDAARRCALVTMASLAFLMGLTGPDSHAAMGQELEVRLTQSGVAGDTGSMWRVQSTGAWEAFRISDGETKAPYAKGMLKPEELAELTGVVEKVKITDLPNSLGGYRRANPETLTVRVGDHVTTLTAPGGTNLLESRTPKSDADPTARRVIEVAQAVRDHTTK